MGLRFALISIVALFLVTCSKHDDQTTTATRKAEIISESEASGSQELESKIESELIPVPSSWIHFRDGIEIAGDTLYLYSDSTFRMIDFDVFFGMFILNGDSLTLNILNYAGDSDYKIASRNEGIIASLDLLIDDENMLKQKVGSKILSWEKCSNVETTAASQESQIISASEASKSKEAEYIVEHNPISVPSAWVHWPNGYEYDADTLYLFSDTTFRLTDIEEYDVLFGKFVLKSDSLALNVLYSKWDSDYAIESQNGRIVETYDFIRNDDNMLMQKVGSKLLSWKDYPLEMLKSECYEYSLGSYFTVCQTKKKLIVRETESGDTIYVGSPYTEVYDSPAGNYLVSLGRDFTIHNRLGKTKKSYEIGRVPERFNHAIISDKDGAGVFYNYEAEGGEYSNVYGLNTETGRFVQLIEIPRSSWDAFMEYEGFFSPNSDMFFLTARASGSEYTKSGGVVFAFNSKTFEEVWRYDFDGDLSGIVRISGACSPDGEYLIVETQSTDLSGGGQMNEGYVTFLMSSEGYVIKKYELVRRKGEYGFNTSLGYLYLSTYAYGTPFVGENIIRLSDGKQLMNVPRRETNLHRARTYSIEGLREYLQGASDYAKKDLPSVEF